jgi:hypothetical protein
MCGKNQRRLAIVQELMKPLNVGLGQIDPASHGLLAVITPEPIEVRKFGPHAAEVFPAPAKDRIDLGSVFFRESGDKIGAPNPVLRKKRPNRAHHPAGEIRHPVGIGQPDAAQYADRKRSKQRIACAFEAAPQATNHSSHLDTPDFTWRMIFAEERSSLFRLCARNSQSPCRTPAGSPIGRGRARNR